MKNFKRWLEDLHLFNSLVLTLLFIILAYLSHPESDFKYGNFTKDGSKLVVSFLIFLFSLIFYIKFKPEKSLSNVIRGLVSGKFSGLYGILGIMFILSFLSWFADSIFDKTEILYTVIISFNIFSFGLLFLLFYPEKKIIKNGNSEIPEKRKVLIMGLSFFNGFDKEEETNKLYEKLKTKDIEKDTISSNWQLPLRALKHHSDTLEKVYFIVSNESGEEKHFTTFERAIDILNETGKLNFPKEKIKKSSQVNFNDVEDITEELRKILREIKREGYKDSDISVNISGGTSALTLCLTLFALEDERQIEYFTQFESPAKLKRFNINKEDAILFLKSLSIED